MTFNLKDPSSMVAILIGFVIAFRLFAAVVPSVNTSAETVAATGLPLADLFGGSSGIVMLLLFAAFIIAVVAALRTSRR